MARLGDICKFQSGGTPAKGEPSYFEGSIPWITTVALNGSIINEQNAVDWITEKAIEKSAAKIVPANSVMIGTRVGVGKVAINSVPMSTSQDIISLIDIDEQKWSKAFICKFILGKGSYLNSQARGATIKGIKIETVAGLQLPDIPLEQQCKITTVIEAVDNLISLRKQQLAKLDEFVKARFVELFGDPEHNEKQWDVFKLDALCSVSSSKRIYQNELSEEGVPFLRISDLVKRMDTGSTECELYIPEERYEELKTLGLVPVAGDMLITARGTLGRCYTLAENDRFYFQDGMITWLYDFDKALTTNYLTHLFAMRGFRKQIDSLQAGSTVAYLSISMTKKLDVMLPPLELQNQFAAFVEQTDKSKMTIQQSLDKLESLKKSLMQKYFE